MVDHKWASLLSHTNTHAHARAHTLSRKHTHSIFYTHTHTHTLTYTHTHTHGRYHRIWVVDDDRAPVGVVSITDLLHHLVFAS